MDWQEENRKDCKYLCWHDETVYAFKTCFIVFYSVLIIKTILTYMSKSTEAIKIYCFIKIAYKCI